MQLFVSILEKKVVRFNKWVCKGHKKTLMRFNRVFKALPASESIILPKEMPPCMPYKGKQGTQSVIRIQA
jgi:hypothetical protein